MTLETGDVIEPELAVRACPFCDFLNPLRIQLIDTLPAFFFFVNEPGGSKNSEVLRDCRPADSESRGELVYRRRSAAKPVQNGSPGGICYCAEDVRVSGLTVHAGICNLLVTYRQGWIRFAIFRLL